MENYFFSENIYLFAKKKRKMNCSHQIACADDNTQVIRSHCSHSRKLNFLARPDIAFGLVYKRSGFKIISGHLVCCLCD